jgi:folylpolyglutamate synthase/dihydropteroate synthase
MLARLSAVGARFVATRRRNPRALAGGLAARADRTSTASRRRRPADALRRAARSQARRRVLVTGSLYLLADLARPIEPYDAPRPWSASASSPSRRSSLALFVGLAFAAGYA